MPGSVSQRSLASGRTLRTGPSLGYSGKSAGVLHSGKPQAPLRIQTNGLLYKNRKLNFFSNGQTERGFFWDRTTPVEVFDACALGALCGMDGTWAINQCEEHTAWANEILKEQDCQPITDLRRSVADGHTLVNLVEILTNEKVPGVHTKPLPRSQKVDNLNNCIDHLDARAVDVQGLTAEELADGNLKSSLMLMNNVRKKFDLSYRQRDLADGAIQSPQTSSQPNSRRNSTNAGHMAEFEKAPALPPRTPPAPKPESGLYGHRSHRLTNGSVDILPGVLSHGERGPSPGIPPNSLVSTEEELSQGSHTELAQTSASQMGAEERRSYLTGYSKPQLPPRPRGNKPVLSPETQPPPSSTTHAWLADNSPLRPRVTCGPATPVGSSSVQDRLKSLLKTQAVRNTTPANGVYNGAYDYEDGELLVPPPPKPVDDSSFDENQEPGGKVNRCYRGDDDQPYTYIPSRPSERVQGSRGQMLLDAPRYTIAQKQHQEKATPSSPRDPPRYQPPPQYNARTGSDSSNSSTTMQSTGMNQVNSDIRSVCNKLFVRDTRNTPAPFSQSSNTYGPSPLLKQTSGIYSHPHSRTSPAGQSSSATQSQGSSMGGQSPSEREGKSPLPGYKDYGNDPRPQQIYGPSQEQGIYGQVRDQGNRSHPGYPDNRTQSVNQIRTSGAPPSGHPNMFELASQTQETTFMDDARYPGTRGENRAGTQYHPHRLPNWGRAKAQLDDSRPNYEDYASVVKPSQTTQEKSIYNCNKMDVSMNGASSPHKLDVITSTAQDIAQRAAANHMSSTPNMTSSQHAKFSQWRHSVASEISMDSDRSVTPPLPPLSPDNTPPETPPDSPPLRPESQAYGYLATKTPDVVTSTGRKPQRKRLTKKTIGGFTGNGRSKRSAPSRAGYRGLTVRNASLNTPGNRDSLDSIQESFPDDSFLDEGSTTNGGSATEDMAEGGSESLEVRAIRRQLGDLQMMYAEVLTALGIDREYLPGSRRSISSQSSVGRTGRRFRHTNPNTKYRREQKQTNKRFVRLESHVVTLARSVAHLSSEMRAQQDVYQDVDDMKEELQAIRKPRKPGQGDITDWEKFRGWVPSLTNPKRVDKLTKFFGQKPPLLQIFLKKLGYEKYLPNFEKEEISLTELPYMNEERLKKIGIPMGPRLRILQESQMCFRQENFDIYIV